ncbi:MAG: hypothetical protein QGI78_03310 [Phycisphaerales bacterium]|jgi:hypothetical protein|nr:hypothetical protein [Phycisphaerales bacterium]
MKNENHQFDAQELQLEAMLTEALSDVHTPEEPSELADRVLHASSHLLGAGKQLDALISKSSESMQPEGLADRVMAASAPLLSQSSELAALLSEATHVATPEGLQDRVFSASVTDLRAESPVIGRVGFAVKMQRLALAACVVFAVLVAFRMDLTTAPQPTRTIAVQNNQLLSVEEEGYLLEDLNLGEYAYLTDTRELDFVAIASEFNGLREDLELWQYGLLNE